MSIRIRECRTDSMMWFGFRVFRGMLYGTHNGENFVWTGEVRPAKRRDGTVYGKQVKVWTILKKNAWESDQTYRRSDWYPQWIDCGSGVGKKVLDRSLTREFSIVKPPRFEGSGGRHLFNSARSDHDYASDRALAYEYGSRRIPNQD